MSADNMLKLLEDIESKQFDFSISDLALPTNKKKLTHITPEILLEISGVTNIENITDLILHHSGIEIFEP